MQLVMYAKVKLEAQGIRGPSCMPLTGRLTGARMRTDGFIYRLSVGGGRYYIR